MRRELWEETGFSIQDCKLLLIEGSRQAHKVILTYLCTGVGGTFAPNEEVSMVQYFDTGGLPAFEEEHHATIEKVLAILKDEAK